MSEEKQIDYSHRIITIPNLLSLFRIVLIPCFMYFYLHENNDLMAFITLAVSGLSDVFDGRIARRFNMISEFGKAIDPIADKLTQVLVVFCLMKRYNYLKPLLILQVIKEFMVGLTSLIALIKENNVRGADWHGKVVTALMYTLILLHLLPFRLPESFIMNLLYITEFMMAVSLILYLIRNLSAIRADRQK